MTSIHHVRRLYRRTNSVSRIMKREPKHIMLFASSSFQNEITEPSLSNFSTFSIKRKIPIQKKESSFLKSLCMRTTIKSVEQNMMCNFWNQNINNVGRLYHYTSSTLAAKQLNTTPSSNDDTSSSDWMGFMNLVETNNRNDNDPNRSISETKTSMDVRAQIKLQTLQKVKDEANQLKQSVSINSRSEESIKEWMQKEEELARAYSQAIKYVARNTKHNHSAKQAEELLHEMIERMGLSYDLVQLRKKDVVCKMIQSAPNNNNNNNDIKNKSLLWDPTKQNDIILSRRDFHNVLHSWASSKAKQKGNYAEALLQQMVDLSYRYPNMLGDVKPNSQTFALVVKCHAGSTHNQSLERIVKLHEIHTSMIDHGLSGFTSDDPFFLMHSLKSLKNFRKKEELRLAKDWFHRLHTFVSTQTQYDNDKKKIDLTGTYTTIIRQYAKLRGQHGAANSARDVLDKMHELSKIQKSSINHIAEMSIKSNAYDLVLGSYSDSKDNEINIKAFDLLTDMIQSWNNHCHGESDTSIDSIPSPTETSFVHGLKALRNMNDLDELKTKSKQLMDYFETIHIHHKENKDNDHGDPIKVYNACLELYTHAFTQDPSTLLSLFDTLFQRMKKVKSASIQPNVMTHSLTLKAYSMGDDSMEEANKVFQILQKQEENERNRMTDSCYFHMMKCVAKFECNIEKRENRIIELFSEACEKGLVSANVLKAFKLNVTEEIFSKKVGSGRLADKWIQNVTSPRAIYSDLSKGGAGKNARRKGKSTSGWKKKKGKEIEMRKTRKALKLNKSQ